MLKNIKSSYFSIIIFYFLDEKIKLQLIKYNKSFQKKLDIKIIKKSGLQLPPTPSRSNYFELFKKQFIFETAFHLAFSFFIEFSITKIFINTKHGQLIDNFIQCLTFFGQYIFNITFISV